MKAAPYLIGIAGPSGAGKTFLAEHLAAALKSAEIVPVDAYYPDLGHLTLEERNRINFDDPGLMDTALLSRHIASLAQGEAIEMPIYNFPHHTRTQQTRRIEPVAYVLVEGLFALYWQELRSLLHTAVYVDMQDAVCLERRIARDVHERGRTQESVERQFNSYVLPMAELHVRPTARYADVIVRGDTEIEAAVSAVLAHVRRPRT